MAQTPRRREVCAPLLGDFFALLLSLARLRLHMLVCNTGRFHNFAGNLIQNLIQRMFLDQTAVSRMLEHYHEHGW